MENTLEVLKLFNNHKGQEPVKPGQAERADTVLQLRADPRGEHFVPVATVVVPRRHLLNVAGVLVRGQTEKLSRQPADKVDRAINRLKPRDWN